MGESGDSELEGTSREVVMQIVAGIKGKAIFFLINNRVIPC